MKAFAQIFFLAGTAFSILAAAADPPLGYIQPSNTPDCADIGGVNDPVEFFLPLNKCTQLNAFASFKGGVSVFCPKGKTPQITAFSGTQCDGNSVMAVGIPANSHAPGACSQILVAARPGSVSVDGQSAKFMCI